MNFVVEKTYENERLDKFLQIKIQNKTRSFIKNKIDGGSVLVNNISVKAGHLLKTNDNVFVCDQAFSEELLPEDIAFDVVYEDDDVLVINKPKNLVVHPTPANKTGTLVNALLAKNVPLSDVGDNMRQGIVHRLDRNTSGLLLVAKNNAAHENLSNQIKERKCKRFYLAILEGNFKEDRGHIKTYFARDKKNRAKMAVSLDKNDRLAYTKFKLMKNFKDYALVEFELVTGRTHQIRVHSAHINHAVLGDKTYNTKKSKMKISSQLLHAYKLQFYLPSTGEIKELEIDLPDEFKRILKIVSQ